MKLVISTLTHRSRPLVEVVERLAQRGVKLIELGVDDIHSNADHWPVTPGSMMSTINRSGITVNSIHIPLSRISPSASDIRKKGSSLRLSLATIDLAVLLSAGLVVQHVELDSPGAVDSPDLLERTTPDLRKVAAHAAKLGVKVALENVPDKPGLTMLGNRPLDVIKVVEALDSEAVGMCLDVTHSVASGHEPVEMLRHIDPIRLFSLHLSDNRFGLNKDIHLPIGQGQISWPKLFGLIRQKGFRGSIVVEVEGQEDDGEVNLADSLAYLEAYRDYFDGFPG